MKNLYCSFLNSSEAFVSGNRLINKHPDENLKVGAESPEGAKKEGSGLFDLVRRGQSETQKKIDRLDFVKLKARIDTLNKEREELRKEDKRKKEGDSERMRMNGDNNYEDPPSHPDIVNQQVTAYRELMTIVEELNDKYGIGIDLDKPGISIRTTDGGDIVVRVGAPRGTTDEITIRLDGTFVKTKMKTDVKERAEHFSFDGGGGELHILPEGKKAPDEF